MKKHLFPLGMFTLTGFTALFAAPLTASAAFSEDTWEYTQIIDEENDSILFEFKDSSIRCLTASELSHLNREELQMGINEIYARNHRKFLTKSILEYFDSKSWYTGTVEAEKFDETSLNQYEGKNIVTSILYDYSVGDLVKIGYAGYLDEEPCLLTMFQYTEPTLEEQQIQTISGTIQDIINDFLVLNGENGGTYPFYAVPGASGLSAGEYVTISYYGSLESPEPVSIE